MLMKEVYTTQALMPLLGITVISTLTRRAKHEGWQSRKRSGRGGGYEWIVASMPEDTRAAIAAALAKSLPVKPLVASDLLIPDWSFDMARARYRLVMEWRAFVAHAAKKGIRKLQATDEFFLLLQAGEAVPAAVLEAVGAYSIPTVYRWDKQLRESGDNLDVLADRRGKWLHGGAKGLGQLGPEVEGVLLRTWLQPNRPSMSFAYGATKRFMEKNGIVMPSYTSAKRFLQRFNANHHDLVTLKREGEKALRDKVGPYIARNDKILDVGDILFADGHVLNFTSKHPTTGKPCRLTLVVWFDWRSRMPVGWEIMPEETVLAIASALHMGIRHMGKYPKVVYIDNGKAFRAKYFSSVTDFEEMDGLYNRLGIDVQHSKAYAAQTKILERFWGTFNEQCARMLPSYSGNSIDDKPAHLHRAEQYHKSRHNDFVPTVDETAYIFGAFVKWYAENDHDGLNGNTPWSVFEPGRGPGVDTTELDRQFLLRKVVNPKRTGFVISGIRFESDALYGLNKPVLATYAWADLSHVSLYDIESGTRIGTARPVEALNPLARVFGDELDMFKVAEANKRQTALKRKTLELARELDGAPEALDALPWMRPALERRVPLTVISGGKAEAQPPALPSGTLTEEDAAELAATSRRIQAEKAAEPTYTVPPFFASQRERYECLFELSVMEGVTLTREDAAFMAQYEQSPAYAASRGRYADLRAMIARRNNQAMPQEATA